MEIIQSNTPKFIDESEHSDFVDYLKRDDKIYFVLLESNSVIACGGYGVNDAKTIAGMSWGLVHRDFHQKGFGSKLLQFRLDQIREKFPKAKIQLDTSQLTYPFFEKFGFVVKNITKDAWGEGLHKIEMVL